MTFFDLPPQDVFPCNDLPDKVWVYNASERALEEAGWSYLIAFDAWVSPAGMKALYPTAVMLP